MLITLLITHLKNKQISDIDEMWIETYKFFWDLGIIITGGFTRFHKFIVFSYDTKSEIKTFKIDLYEILNDKVH
jgi:hypothetical protein